MWNEQVIITANKHEYYTLVGETEYQGVANVIVESCLKFTVRTLPSDHKSHIAYYDNVNVVYLSGNSI